MQKARKTQRASVAKKCHDSLYWRSVGHWLRAGHGKGVGHQVVPLQLIADWLKGTSTGSYHLSWEKAWFPLDFPLNQFIEFCFNVPSILGMSRGSDLKSEFFGFPLDGLEMPIRKPWKTTENYALQGLWVWFGCQSYSQGGARSDELSSLKTLVAFSRMRSKGSHFNLGVWGLRVRSLHVAFTFTTVRNRPQPFATVPFARGPYGRDYGKFCRRGPFWGFQMSRCFVSRGRRGTS